MGSVRDCALSLFVDMKGMIVAFTYRNSSVPEGWLDILYFRTSFFVPVPSRCSSSIWMPCSFSRLSMYSSFDFASV